MWVPSILKQSFRVFGLSSQNRIAYIGTHNGKFHCDEVFACWMLKTLPEYKDHLILRTRNQNDLDKCDIVVDVGGVFDHTKKRYDHHQRSFTETMNSLSVLTENDKLKVNEKALPYNTKLSSAGLVYGFYGKEVIRNILEKDGVLDIKDDELNFYYDILYKEFVEAIDAVDNGIKSHDDQAKYVIPVSIQSLVDDLNPSWNEEGASEDVRFMEAMQVVGKIFTGKVLYIHNSWMPCRQIVERALLDRKNVHKSGRVMVLPESCPWKKHFFMLEEELGIHNQLVYVVYPGDSAKTNWRVQAIPTSESTEFDNRCPLPEAWRGKRDEELSKIADVKDAVFIHATGFIGGAKSKEETIKLAVKSLQIHNMI